jgi:hypothetical protein
MRRNNCEEIRRELDELMLEEASSTSAVEHLKKCSACREFNESQVKLRRMVGSLGIVAAPADFDFRLRARLANDSGNGAFHYWPLVQKGFAVAAVVIVFGFGIVVVRNVLNQRKEAVAVQHPAVPQESPIQVQTPQSNTGSTSGSLTANAPSSGPDKTKSDRVVQTGSKTKPPLTAIDFSKQRAEVISGAEAIDTGTVFPIDASLQPLRLSLDDGRGNARTISVPTVRFGSQRILPNRNQFSEKGIW